MKENCLGPRARRAHRGDNPRPSTTRRRLAGNIIEVREKKKKADKSNREEKDVNAKQRQTRKRKGKQTGHDGDRSTS
jgi:hypothetical protein